MSVIGIKCTFQYCPLVFWIKRKLFLNVQMQANTISLGVFLLLLLSLLFVCLSLLFVFFVCVCVCVCVFTNSPQLSTFNILTRLNEDQV